MDILRTKRFSVFLLTILVILFQIWNNPGGQFVKAKDIDDYSGKNLQVVMWVGRSDFTVNEDVKSFDFPLFIKDGRTFAQVRSFIESIGGAVGWDSVERKVTVSFNSSTIELWINKPFAKVNGIEVKIDANNAKIIPEIVNNRTVIPLRFIAESLGFDVKWDSVTKTIMLNYNPNLISINVGGTYTITLDENPSTGFAWHYKINDQSVVIVEKDSFIPGSSNLPGAPGKHMWTFKGLKSGETEIVFMYYRDWQPNKIEKTVVYEIKVN